jgi:uncharacterized protein (DUF1499 family)
MLILVGLGVLAILVVIALQVDDWSRDLTTNSAATSMDASDPALQSLVLAASIDQVKQAVRRFAQQNDAWTYDASAATETTLALVRKTRWLGFADDVHVFLQATDRGTRVDISSQSRVGKGDLGQNPRNIRELMRRLRDELE